MATISRQLTSLKFRNKKSFEYLNSHFNTKISQLGALVTDNPTLLLTELVSQSQVKDIDFSRDLAEHV